MPFDKEQQAAIDAYKGAFRVDACAGAGKTSTLIARLHTLIKRGVPEANILALTFTKNAAEEMKARAKVEGNCLRTLHSWALETVKAEHHEFTPPVRPMPLLLNKLELLFPLAKQCGAQWKDLDSYISNCKRQGLAPAAAFEQADNDQQEALARAYADYQNSCHRMGVMDFDSIIWELVLLFEAKPEVLARHQIPFLMVDEAQDCSEMDWKMIRLISRQHGNVWVVGDFAQSVYSFRGANPEIFSKFPEAFPGSGTLPMGTNYRSQANIVDYSKQVMPEQTSYLANWKAHKPGTTQPQFLKFDNDIDEAKWVLSRVTNGSCAVNETAILARTNAQLAIVQGFCAEKQIAYKLLGKDNFWKRPEVLALLGLIKNVGGYDDEGLKKVIHSPLPMVKFLRKDDAIATLERLQNGSLSTSTGDKMPFKMLLSRADMGDSRQNEILRDLNSILKMADSMVSSPFAVVEYLASKSGARSLGQDDGDNGETFIQDNIKKVASIAKGFSSIRDLVKFARTAGHPSRKQTRLFLSTVHGFKGKEAKNVFVIGVNLGVFPHDRADLQEEKRLYYVAVSRPTDELFVSCSGIPSPFIEKNVPTDPVAVLPEILNDEWAGTPLFGACQ